MMDDSEFHLFDRPGLPEDMRYLVRTYPRQTWDAGQPIGETARFWLGRHNAFRTLGGAIAERTNAFREGQMDAEPFAGWLVPRLNMFLGELDGHHKVEDHHYFPAFAAAEPKLKRGFDILDNDHRVIHELLDGNAAAGNAFLQSLQQGGDTLARASDAYAGNITHLMAGLMRHLEDEEDVVIPMLIDRGEAPFL